MHTEYDKSKFKTSVIGMAMFRVFLSTLLLVDVDSARSELLPDKPCNDARITLSGARYRYIGPRGDDIVIETIALSKLPSIRNKHVRASLLSATFEAVRLLESDRLKLGMPDDDDDASATARTLKPAENLCWVLLYAFDVYLSGLDNMPADDQIITMFKVFFEALSVELAQCEKETPTVDEILQVLRRQQVRVRDYVQNKAKIYTDAVASYSTDASSNNPYVKTHHNRLAAALEKTKPNTGWFSWLKRPVGLKLLDNDELSSQVAVLLDYAMFNPKGAEDAHSRLAGLALNRWDRFRYFLFDYRQKLQAAVCAWQQDMVVSSSPAMLIEQYHAMNKLLHSPRLQRFRQYARVDETAILGSFQTAAECAIKSATLDECLEFIEQYRIDKLNNNLKVDQFFDDRCCDYILRLEHIVKHTGALTNEDVVRVKQRLKIFTAWAKQCPEVIPPQVAATASIIDRLLPAVSEVSWQSPDKTAPSAKAVADSVTAVLATSTRDPSPDRRNVEVDDTPPETPNPTPTIAVRD